MEKEATLKKWGLVSWEPEILISAGLIVSLYNVQPLLVIFYNILSPFEIEGVAFMMVLLSGIAGVLAVGFSLHLILRAYWLMKMGIAYTFSNKIDIEGFEFKPLYYKQIKRLNLLKSGLRIGQLASLFFGINFFLLLISMGVLLTFLFGMSLSRLFNFPGIVFFILICIPFIDFISMGRLKRTKASTLLYPVLVFFNILTLSFLYRDIYYSLISNVKWYALLIGAFFFILSFNLLAFVNGQKILRFENPLRVDTPFEDYNRNYYKDERDTYSLSTVMIDSYHHENDLMKLFVRKSPFINVALANEAVQVRIDGSPIKIKTIRDYRGEEFETGYLFFLDLKNIQNNEEHLLTWYIIKEKMPKRYYSGGYEFEIEIPFYKAD